MKSNKTKKTEAAKRAAAKTPTARREKSKVQLIIHHDSDGDTTVYIFPFRKTDDPKAYNAMLKCRVICSHYLDHFREYDSAATTEFVRLCSAQQWEEAVKRWDLTFDEENITAHEDSSESVPNSKKFAKECKTLFAAFSKEDEENAEA